MTSAEKALGMGSQPLTTASPFAQIFLRVFSLTGVSLGERPGDVSDQRTLACAPGRRQHDPVPLLPPQGRGQGKGVRRRGREGPPRMPPSPWASIAGGEPKLSRAKPRPPGPKVT